jgi:hydroxyethylthiazole kinase
MRASSDLASSFAAQVPHAAGDILERLRARAPRVHCITNNVAQAFTANFLLAAGATPSMTISPAEIGAFAESANAILVNLGTFDGERRESVLTALEVVRHHGKPWVLDPVLIDRSEARAGFAKTLLARKPCAMRLNAAELLALGGSPDKAGVAAFAMEISTVVALSGATDLVADATRCAALANGHPLMGRVTAMGCAVSALIAACAAVEDDGWLATSAALLIAGTAGEIAGAQAGGPGSFVPAMIDALFTLDKDALLARARVS